MDKRLKEHESQIKEIIKNGISLIYTEAHSLVGTEGGDISPNQENRLEDIKETLFVELTQQLAQNLPDELDIDFVKSKIETKTFNIIDSDDFDDIVTKAYGTNYEIVAEQELNNNSVIEVEVPNEDVLGDDEAMKSIRNGNYPRYSVNYIALCLYEDGYLPEGKYQITVNW